MRTRQLEQQSSAGITTMIASVYGMNFDLMPELHWHMGHPCPLPLMLLMLASPLAPCFWFKKMKWL